MGIRLTFTDTNSAEDGYNVYRHTSSIAGLETAAELDPYLIAELPADATGYDDGGALDDQTYYYRVATVSGGEVYPGAEIEITAATFARYWRLYIYANGGDNETGLAEMEMRAVVSGADQTGAGTASASHEDASNLAADAFDDSTATQWLTPIDGGDTADVWLQYDFGSGNDVSVSETSITNETAARAPTDFALEYSDDGTTWTEVDRWTATWASDGETQAFAV